MRCIPGEHVEPKGAPAAERRSEEQLVPDEKPDDQRQVLQKSNRFVHESLNMLSGLRLAKAWSPRFREYILNFPSLQAWP